MEEGRTKRSQVGSQPGPLGRYSESDMVVSNKSRSGWDAERAARKDKIATNRTKKRCARIYKGYLRFCRT